MKYLLAVLLSITVFNINCFAAPKKKEIHIHDPKDASKRCSECHDMSEGKKYVHMPVKLNSCSSCHNTFIKTKNLLRTPHIIDICILCHTKKRTLIKTGKNIHPPVKQDCTNCHDPHAGNFKFRLKADKKRALCLTCHKKKKRWIKNVKNRHGAMNLKNGGCIACHDPHGTDRPKMIKESTVQKLCLSCHNKRLKRDEDGKMLQNIEKHLKNNNNWHGPIKKGKCTACHNPHGSNNHRMLKGAYPTTYTAKFDPKSYVCFKCHKSNKITRAKTTKTTKFRRGDKNLHTVHVKNYKLICGTCHDFHASKKPKPLIKDKTIFGRTEFKLRYIKTANGGSCNPVCHNKREYDRRFNPK